MDPSLYAYPDSDRPWLRTNFVTTLDGAVQDESGLSGSLGGDADHEVFTLLRTLADLVIVGAETARAEGYGPAKQSHRRVPIAVVSRSLKIPESLVVPGQILITTADAPPEPLARLHQTMDVIAVGKESVDWNLVIDELHRRGFRRLLCEGGPTIHGQLIEADLVDELCWTIAPVLTAGGSPRLAHSAHAVTRTMRLVHALPIGDVIVTRWSRSPELT